MCLICTINISKSLETMLFGCIREPMPYYFNSSVYLIGGLRITNVIDMLWLSQQTCVLGNQRMLILHNVTMLCLAIGMN